MAGFYPEFPAWKSTSDFISGLAAQATKDDTANERPRTSAPINLANSGQSIGRAARNAAIFFGVNQGADGLYRVDVRSRTHFGSRVDCTAAGRTK